MSSLPTAPVTAPPREAVDSSRQPISGSVPVWKSVALLAAGLLVWIVFSNMPLTTLAPQAGVVMQLPGYVSSGSGFIGTTADVTPAERYILPKDTEFARKNYTDFPDQDYIFCGIVLSGALNQSIHRPEVCLVAQGFNITDQEDLPIRLDSGHVLTVRNLTIKKTQIISGQSRTIVEYNMYWFVGQQVTTPYHYMRIFLSSWDRIAHNRANRWAYVTVSAPIMSSLRPNGKDAAQTRAMMIDFIKHTVPKFQKSEMANNAAD